MGDKVVLVAVEHIYGRLYQLDLHNETRDEFYRVFVDKGEFQKMLKEAEEKGDKEDGC